MADTVVHVNLVHAKDNPAAMEQKINELIEAKYSGDGWVRQGPNFMHNTLTGDDVNLNQEAYAILEQEGPRNDAVAVVETPEGEQRSVFIHQDAVAAAGGDMQTLKANLQTVLGGGPLSASGISPWFYVAGAGLLAVLVMRRRGGGTPAHFRRHG